MENRFNLIDEPWIPVADVGRVSLRQIFSDPTYRSLGGNPVQKIALMKLLLAIAQAAATPDDDKAWREIGSEGVCGRCLDYLEQWHERFYLYGEKPFLQMPAIAAAAVQPFGAVLPEVSTGNTTILSEVQIARALEDADKALLLLTQMGFALSGKKTDNKIVLSAGYAGKRNEKGKASTGKPGPSVAYMGLLHNYLLGANIHESIWLNLIPTEQIQDNTMFQHGLGVAPWENMPDGEACPVALELKEAVMGRLIPLCRFCLLHDDGFHYSEGIAHAGYKEGMVDPSVAINYSGKEPKALWVDPEKRPWRELTSLLSFFDQQSSKGFECWQINVGLDRARDATKMFGLWSGGLRVSSTAGEQFVSGNDDFVESLVWLHSDMLGAVWFTQLKAEMDSLNQLAKGLYGCVAGFFKEQKVDGLKMAAQASHLFWQLSERDFQTLVNACDPDEQGSSQRQQLRRRFASYIQQAYDQFCPRETARQLDAWAKCRPNNSKYLKQES
ncbi:MAG: type I-E CRISPR-associated protein Cse1/CasA [Gammaproteobacteria bacterium]|nr:type I-E CRISPR-associated protein Cse1/CasA [Gammaproteobacteria bacterium]